MNQSLITKIKNGKIPLPKNLRRAWRGESVVFLPTKNGLYIKSITPPALSALETKLKAAGKLITEKDVSKAVKQARRTTYPRRT